MQVAGSRGWICNKYFCVHCLYFNSRHMLLVVILFFLSKHRVAFIISKCVSNYVKKNIVRKDKFKLYQNQSCCIVCVRQLLVTIISAQCEQCLALMSAVSGPPSLKNTTMPSYYMKMSILLDIAVDKSEIWCSVTVLRKFNFFYLVDANTEISVIIRC